MFCLRVTFHSTVVKVITCGFPPLEDRDKSLKSLAQHDFFGGGTLTKEETVSLTRSDNRRNIIHGSEICSSSSKLCCIDSSIPISFNSSDFQSWKSDL